MNTPENWTMEDSALLDIAMFPPRILDPDAYAEYKKRCKVTPNKSIEAVIAAWGEYEWTMGNGQCKICCGLSPDKQWGLGRDERTGHNPRCFIAIAMEHLGAEVQFHKEDSSEGKPRKGYVSTL